jgi:hypothetical protein
MTDPADIEWRDTGIRNGWKLPFIAPWPMRLPGVRHLRAMYAYWQIERHYSIIQPMGLIRTGYDEWVVWAIARGIC